MVIKRSDLEVSQSAKDELDMGYFERIIDKALKETDNSVITGVCLSIDRMPNITVQRNLISIYGNAGWNIKFHQGAQYNEIYYSVEVKPK